MRMLRGPRILVQDSIMEDGQGRRTMEAEWIYLTAITAGLGVFAGVLFYMSIYAPGPHR